MYFKHENGSYKRVPQYPNAQLGYEGCVSFTYLIDYSNILTYHSNSKDDTNINGGMTIYYTEKNFDTDGTDFITAFPPVRYKTLFHNRVFKVQWLILHTTGLSYDSWQPHRNREKQRHQPGIGIYLLGHNSNTWPRNA